MADRRIVALRLLSALLVLGSLVMVTFAFLLGGMVSDDGADRARTLVLGLALVFAGALLAKTRTRWSAYTLAVIVAVGGAIEISAKGTLHVSFFFWIILALAAALAWPTEGSASKP